MFIPRRAFFGLVSVCLLFLTGAAKAAVNLAVDVNPDPAQPGQQVLVEIVVTNSGLTPTSNLTVTLPYPAGVDGTYESYISGPLDAAASCVGGTSTLCTAGETILWSLGILAPGQALRLSLPPVVSLGTATGTAIPWEATVADTGGPLDTQTATLPVDATPALTLSIDEDRDPVPAGGTLAYRLRYGNRSAASVTGTQLEFSLPANASFVSASGGGSLGGGVVSWSLATLPAGAVGEQTLWVQIDGGAADGDLVRSEALISGTSSASPTSRGATETAYVAPSTPLNLALDVTPLPALPNEEVQVVLTVTNPGASNVFGAVVRMPYPAGMNDLFESYISGPLDTAASCVQGTSTLCSAGETIEWVLGTLAPGQAVRLSLPPVVASTTVSGSLIPWEAELSDDSGALAIASATLPVDAAPALTLAIDEDQDPVPAGATLAYRLRYGNRSAASVTGTQLDFTLPANASLLATTGGGTLSGDVLSWSLATLPAGAVGEQTLWVQLDGGAADGDLVRSEALISGTSSALPTARQATETAYVAPSTPLNLALDVTPLPALPNEEVQVVLTVTNPGTSNVFGAVVRLRYPAGMNNIFENDISGPLDAAASCAQGTSTLCSPAETIEWSLGTLAPGQVVQMSLSPVVTSTTALGSLIGWSALVTEDGGSLRRLTEALAIGPDFPPGPADHIGVYRPSNLRFFLDIDGNYLWDAGDFVSPPFGISGDIPVTGDWNGDGFDEIGVYRPSAARFYLDLNGNDQWDGTPTDVTTRFGAVGDEPVIGDWNGDGFDEIGVYRPGAARFYLDLNGNDLWDNTPTDATARFGAVGDEPIIGDWNGDHLDDIGVYRPAISRFYLDFNGNDLWDGAPTDLTTRFGAVGDEPIIGDWNGDHLDDIGTYRPPIRRFFLDSNGNDLWDGTPTDASFAFGALGDRPVIGLW